MDFCKQIFEKSLNNLTTEIIEDYFISPKEENLIIEFKSYHPNSGLDKIKESICAFLNSEGGVIIWGSPDGKKISGRKEKEFQGPLTPVNEFFEHDQLISKITDSIIPLPIGIAAKAIQKGSGYVYIIEVQKSNYSPHQFQNIYYARLDGKNNPAPHYLIEALFRKIKYPNIEGYLHIENILHDNNKPFTIFLKLLLINFSELQNEQQVKFRLISNIGKFDLDFEYNTGEIYDDNDKRISYIHEKTLHYGEPIIINEKLTILMHELSKWDNKVELRFVFGGKHSPLKYSYYILDLSRLLNDYLESPEDIISFKEENKFFSLNGMSKEEILKEFKK